jgi:hypothetical protein
VNEKLIAAFAKNDHEQVRLYLTEYAERPMIDLRVWAETQDGTWVRTRKGITMSAEHYQELRTVIEGAEEVLAAATSVC